MTREEKAQAHDEALERARKLHSEYRTIVGTNIPEEIFPELKESEDVMWRNWLIGHLAGYINQTNYKYAKVCKEAITWLKKQGESDETKAKRFLINKGYPIDTNGTFPTYEEIYDIIKMGFEEQGNKSVNIDIESMVSSYKQRLKSQGGIENSPLVNMCLTAFRHGVENALEELNLKKLEKQGEQKTVDKTEPKFKVGDWVVWDNKISCHIDNIYQGKEFLMYTITDTNNMTRTYSVKGFDSNARLWTIVDVKDGDVLAALECYVIFKEIDGLNIKCYCTYHYMNDPSFYVDSLQNKDAFHPATKEQRDTLFAKLKEAGYEWDSEKKELKKIEVTNEESENKNIRKPLIDYFDDADTSDENPY